MCYYILTMQSKSTSIIKQIKSLRDMKIKLSKSNLYEKMPTNQPDKIVGIFQLAMHQDLNSSSLIKTKVTSFYQYRLLYYFLLYLAFEVRSQQINPILIDNLINQIHQHSHDKLLIVPGLQKYGCFQRKQVLEAIQECMDKIQNFLGKQPIVKVINSDKSKKYDLCFITAIYNLVCKEGSIEFLLSKLGVQKSLITFASIEINQHIMKISPKSGVIEFKIEWSHFSGSINTFQSIELMPDDINQNSFRINFNNSIILRDSFNHQFCQLQEQLVCSDSNNQFDNPNNYQLDKNYIISNFNQTAKTKNTTPLFQTPPDNFPINSKSKYKMNKFPNFDFFTKQKDVHQLQLSSNNQQKLSKNNRLAFTKVINEIYIPYRLENRTADQMKSNCLKKQRKCKSKISHTNRMKNYSLDDKITSITTIEDSAKTSQIFEMKHLINNNIPKYFSKQQIKPRKIENRRYPQSFKQLHVIERNIDDAAECRRKLLQQHLKRTNQQL